MKKTESTPKPAGRIGRLALMARRRVAIVTGSRAEFGLLRPVMDAVGENRRLERMVVAAGSHLLAPARTIREVAGTYAIAARVPMQKAGKTGRLADTTALGRGIEGFARAFKRLKPDWVVVLGDRIEAFAAAAAASVGGIAVAHLHGGDRAEGVADEAMRHAITKLAHLHLAATAQSAERIVRMGENEQYVHVVGSPAIDGLKGVKPLGDREFAALGSPAAVVLMHPAGLDPKREQDFTLAAIVAARTVAGEADPAGEPRVLLLEPNFDAGREGVMKALEYAHKKRGWPLVSHLPRASFAALLARLARDRGALVGNSSAGLIEAAALGVAVINVGPRQAGRERAGNVVELATLESEAIGPVVDAARELLSRMPGEHPYGDGRTGPRVARLLAEVDPRGAPLLRKRCAY